MHTFFSPLWFYSIGLFYVTELNTYNWLWASVVYIGCRHFLLLSVMGSIQKPRRACRKSTMLLRESLLTYSFMVCRNCTLSSLYRLVRQFWAYTVEVKQHEHTIQLTTTNGVKVLILMINNITSSGSSRVFYFCLMNVTTTTTQCRNFHLPQTVSVHFR